VKTKGVSDTGNRSGHNNNIIYYYDYEHKTNAFVRVQGYRSTSNEEAKKMQLPTSFCLSTAQGNKKWRKSTSRKV
jgi:hypothetical protein